MEVEIFLSIEIKVISFCITGDIADEKKTKAGFQIL
jgi:hypothetical protein